MSSFFELAFFGLLFTLVSIANGERDRRRCSGTRNALSYPSYHNETRNSRGWAKAHLAYLKRLYTGCQVVDLSLELTYLDDTDLSFLQGIEEIVGNLVIYNTTLTRLSLPRLRVIRGIVDEGIIAHAMSVVIVQNNRLQELDLSRLDAIAKGSVLISANHYLCWLQTISWSEILVRHDSNVKINSSNFAGCPRDTNFCDHCSSGSCFGPSDDQCQRHPKSNCALQCSTPPKTCYEKHTANACCHRSCLNGCSGPSEKDCFSCAEVSLNGTCLDHCPSKTDSRPRDDLPDALRDMKRMAHECVHKCPGDTVLFKDETCLHECPTGYGENKKLRICERCDIYDCKADKQKVCSPAYDEVTSRTIEHLENCTILEGDLIINSHAFQNRKKHMFQCIDHRAPGCEIKSFGTYAMIENITALNYDILKKYLHELRVVEGAIRIEDNAQRPGLQNLSFLENLETVEGRNFDRKHNYAMNVYLSSEIGPTTQFLGLKSLKDVKNHPIVLNLQGTCYSGSLNLTRINADTKSIVRFRNESLCEAEGKTCDPLCSDDGCWGPGPSLCLACLHYETNGTCVRQCDQYDGHYIEQRNGVVYCHSCDPLCKRCTGIDIAHCTECRFAKMINDKTGPLGRCVARCPPDMFVDAMGVCQKCHEGCLIERYGEMSSCTGSRSHVGQGGCNRCSIGYRDTSGVRCIKSCRQEFPGYYAVETLGQEAVSDHECRPCHAECSECTSYGTHVVDHRCDCRHATQMSDDGLRVQCVAECADGFYSVRNNKCFPCHAECQTCRGPEPHECMTCKNFRVSLQHLPALNFDRQDNETLFNCTAVCPGELPYHDSKRTCLSEPPGARTIPIVVGVTSFLLLLSLLAVTAVVFVFRRKIHLAQLVKNQFAIEPNPDPNTKPIMARLQIVKENELRRGDALGHGAFGTVYKGVYVPEHADAKIPVAIKELHDETNPQGQRDLLEEASNMAALNHIYLNRLIGICLGKRIQLVTPLQPLGSLIGYVKPNRHKIGSHHLMQWAHQIATGMAYLEANRIVHRDLAARNVLLASVDCVKITDFGLSRMLEFGQEDVSLDGDKVPFRWLALECLQHQRFSHKSDVWAFGVTVWELITFGDRPYGSMSCREVLRTLENGNRLEQPSVCAAPLYKVLLTSWIVNPEARPTFAELARSFASMAKDPGRYLSIPGDKYMRYSSNSSAHPINTSHSASSIDTRRLLESSISTISLMGSMDSYRPLIPDDEYLEMIRTQADRMAGKVRRHLIDRLLIGGGLPPHP